MKLDLGSYKLDGPAWISISLGLVAVIIAAIYFATQNFQSLEMSAHFNLQARDLPPQTSNLKPQTSP